jgi:hypothetical protein
VRCNLDISYDASLTHLPFLGVSSLIDWPRSLMAARPFFWRGARNAPESSAASSPAPLLAASGHAYGACAYKLIVRLCS